MNIRVFLKEYCALTKVPSRLNPKDDQNILKRYIRMLDKIFSERIKTTYSAFTNWTVRMENIVVSKQLMMQNSVKVIAQRA